MTSASEPIEAVETRDVGLHALCGIAAYYRIVATPVQIRRELALRGQEAGPDDLVRAAQLIGLKARIISPLEKGRLAALPAPSILRMRSRAYEVYGGVMPSGEYRLVNPARVVEETMDGHEPEVWISDRYSAQQKHGAAHQTCLAHLARDTAFALEHGSDDLPLRFKLWFGKAFDLARDIASFAASTIASKKRELEKQLAALLAAATGCDLARQLQAKIGRAQLQLLVFCDYPGEVEATNNGSERKLRPCVIQRKVTNGYRAMWAAQAEADVRTTVDTARLNGANPFQTILDTLV